MEISNRKLISRGMAAIGLAVVAAGVSGAAAANSVMHERSFMSSGLPKISCADRPCTASTSSAHSVSRGPSTGCAMYVRASAREEMP